MSPQSSSRALYDVMYACDGYDFTPPCWTIPVPTWNNWYVLPAVMNKVISSMQVLESDVKCLIYASTNCRGNTGGIDGTMGPIGKITPLFNNNVSSVACFPM
ncbi:hypothetical protein BDV98DRAFT_597359 [Pterulicium gracile]|uniref:Uncharacterized protein n=1 Tax=Pterulicium gracile TaxID=1884261 RepID=A0A5C3Q3M7_9AGAR|nr:hypothetical protein BDV98DRAFT_597359 [Pterula gracilis]